jgi:hypothetical protein
VFKSETGSKGYAFNHIMACSDRQSGKKRGSKTEDNIKKTLNAESIIETHLGTMLQRKTKIYIRIHQGCHL